MEVTREYMIEELESLRKRISTWEKELKKPVVIGDDGQESPVYKDGVPPGLRVSEVTGIDEKALRAELVAMSGRLDALANAT